MLLAELKWKAEVAKMVVWKHCNRGSGREVLVREVQGIFQAVVHKLNWMTVNPAQVLEVILATVDAPVKYPQHLLSVKGVKQWENMTWVISSLDSSGAGQRKSQGRSAWCVVRCLATNHKTIASQTASYNQAHNAERQIFWFFLRKHDEVKKSKSTIQYCVTPLVIAQEASYRASLLIMKLGKPHTIGKQLCLPLAKEITHHECGRKQLNPVPLLNNIVSQRIGAVVEDVKNTLNAFRVTAIIQSSWARLQM